MCVEIVCAELTGNPCTAYGTAPMLGWMVDDKDIKPHVPVWDKTGHYGNSLSVGDFWHEDHRATARSLRARQGFCNVLIGHSDIDGFGRDGFEGDALAFP